MSVMEVEGIKLEAADDMVCHHLTRTGQFEPDSLAIWRDWIKRHGGAAVDVGSYTGIYSISAVKCGASQVFAFDPSPRVAERFPKNVILNDVDSRKIHFYNLAVLNEDALNDGWKLDFDASRMSSASRMVRTGGTCSVHAVTLDRFISKRRPVKAMKIDVEGDEWRVLTGAQKLIAEHRPLIIAEFLNDDCIDLIKKAIGDFYTFDIMDERNLVCIPIR